MAAGRGTNFEKIYLYICPKIQSLVNAITQRIPSPIVFKFGMQMSFTQMKAKFDKGAKSTKEYGLAAILKNLTFEKWPVVP